MQQAALADHQCAQFLRHAIEIAAQIGQLVAPIAHRLTQAAIQIAFGGGVESLLQMADRLSEIPGQQKRENQTGEDRGQQRQKGNQIARRGGGGDIVRPAFEDAQRLFAVDMRAAVEAFDRRLEQQVAMAVGSRNFLNHCRGARNQRTRLLQCSGRNRAVQQFMLVLVDCIDRAPPLLLQQLTQGIDAAEMQRGRRRFDAEYRGRAFIDVRMGQLMAAGFEP